MSNVRPFIPKENEKLPDYWGATVHYHDGKTEEFKLASQRVMSMQTSEGIRSPLDIIELISHDDEFTWIPVGSIKKITFDKEFSKVVAINEEMSRKAQQP